MSAFTLAATRAKFARDALLDLPKDAPPEQRAEAEATHATAQRAFAEAARPLITRAKFSRP